MEKTINVYVKWEQFNSDARQWKPSNPVFKPEAVLIAVKVPWTSEYIAEYIADVLHYTDNPDKIILTPKGMRYVIDVMESVMQPAKDNTFDDLKDEDFE